ncbi:hypothetical protein CBM2586_A10290 [Cupriavidus phytorum]|uniref:Uncharacterized protein n=1 Tax=Cupriavidus taiwanensis TaxID=164546 RepID=A0A975ZVL7_9BURK|nr:hypothetical protein [Cupriavidus taiwanensis]SOY40325.1 hypothetical protein CBM2586_A10290 [Cupriavidus taiwanensis]
MKQTHLGLDHYPKVEDRREERTNWQPLRRPLIVNGVKSNSSWRRLTDLHAKVLDDRLGKWSPFARFITQKSKTPDIDENEKHLQYITAAFHSAV